MKKRDLMWPIIVASLVAFAMIFTIWYGTNKAKDIDYYAYADSLDLIEIVNSPDLSMEELAARNGKLIIEQVVGVVTDAETGDGYIVGYPDYYISYASVEGIQNGDVVCSYMVYNPDNNYEDDILIRFDYIIDAN